MRLGESKRVVPHGGARPHMIPPHPKIVIWLCGGFRSL